MNNIVINRVKIELLKEDVSINFFIDEELNDNNNIILKLYLKRYKPSYLHKEIKENLIQTDNKIHQWLDGLKKQIPKDEPYIYISFFKQSDKTLNTKFIEYNKLLKPYVREILIRHFLDNKYIIEPFKEGCDFSVYEELDTTEIKGFKKYRRYDFVIFSYYKEKRRNIELSVSISIGSEDTYIGINEDIKQLNLSGLKVVKDNLLIKYENQEASEYPIKANKEIRNQLKIYPKPKKHFYKNHYELIKKFVEKLNNQKLSEIKIYPIFIKKHGGDIKSVDFEKNKMVFKSEQLDYSPVNGMRDYGVYKTPDNIKNYQLLFIYPDRESANKLYIYFLRGYKHFPGLESYIGLPANLSDKKIEYIEPIETLTETINENLKQSNYNNLIALWIMPFSKSTATKEQSKIYYEIKEILLSKNISSQFVERNKIFNENFHFSLPNIAIAMLAKIGGIPWKLQRKTYKQLTIGFNIHKKDINTYLGSAIYFDNEGQINNIEAYSESTPENICQTLSNSINDYLNKNSEIDKMVIHYYKPLSSKEKDAINELLKRININIPYAFVEINDTKVTTDICFDLSYELYMPRSGTYIYLKPNEYLLFNNLRYWEIPTNPIYQEEYPIKLRICDPTSSFLHHELISQVYEFSRLYWKSLKQQARPVTTIYSKLIAEYVANFQKGLPNTEIAHKKVWFI